MEFLASVAETAQSGTVQTIGLGALAYIAVNALKEVALRKLPVRTVPHACTLTDHQKAALYRIDRNATDLAEAHSTMGEDGPDWKISPAARRVQREHQQAMLDGLKLVTDACERIASRPSCATRIVPLLPKAD